MTGRRNTAETFWARVDKRGPDECWPWTGKVDKRAGHGHIGWKGTETTAHRVAYALTHGTISAGLHVLHRCDNPPCCNPSHLYAGTQADNMRDRAERGRAPHVLSEKDVREIRRLYPSVTQDALAARFGVRQAAIHDIVYRKTWRHVA